MSSDSSPPFSWQFNLGRIPVVVEPSFWLVSVLFSLSSYPDWAAMLSWVGVVFVSVMVHELGHALVGMGLGCDVAVIRLYSFGGLTMLDRSLSRWRDVVMSAAGPVAGFAFGALMLAVSHWVPPHTHLGRVILNDLLFVNFGWGLINLLPVPPLDGGRISRGVLGPTRQRIALWVGLVTALGMVAWSVSLGSRYMAFLFGWMGLGCWQALSVTRDMTPLRPSRPAPPPPREASEPAAKLLATGWDALRGGFESEAGRMACQVLDTARTREERNGANELLAWVELLQNDARRALSYLEKVEPPAAARSFSWAMAYEGVGQYERALPLGFEALRQEPKDEVAALVVRVLVAMKRPDEAERKAREFAWKKPVRRDLLLADVALAREDFGTAASLYAQVFEAAGSPGDAYQAARNHARAGQLEAATRWLERALEAGYQDLEELGREPALAEVRVRPGIAERLAQRTGA